MYSVLARLAAVNARILNDAAKEQILAEIQHLREENQGLEASTRELEERVQTKERVPRLSACQ